MERPFFLRTGRTFDRPKSKAKKEEIRLLAVAAMRKQRWKMTNKTVFIRLVFHGSHGKADLDNLVKLVLDALSKTAWDDDRQIIGLSAVKWPMRLSKVKTPGTLIHIEEFPRRLYGNE